MLKKYPIKSFLYCLIYLQINSCLKRGQKLRMENHVLRVFSHLIESVRGDKVFIILLSSSHYPLPICKRKCDFWLHYYLSKYPPNKLANRDAVVISGCGGG